MACIVTVEDKSVSVLVSDSSYTSRSTTSLLAPPNAAYATLSDLIHFGPTCFTTSAVT